MPIRHCTKCGLKVLVNDAQAATADFLCQRCATGGPAAKPPSAGGRPSVKCTCPFCKASFSGGIPSKPAKGACPVCRKDLILLPDGNIQGAAGFDIAAWQREQDAKKPAVEEAFPEPGIPGGLGDQTMLGMGDIAPGPRKPGPKPPAPTKFPAGDDLEALPGLAEPTMLGMGDAGGPRKPKPAPAGDLEGLPGLGDQTMLGMGDIPTMPKKPASKLPPPTYPHAKKGEDLEALPGLAEPTMLGMGEIPSGPQKPHVRMPPPGPKKPPSEELERLPGQDHTMLGMGDLDKPADGQEIDSIPLPPDLGDQTMLGMGALPELPPAAEPKAPPKPAARPAPRPAPPPPMDEELEPEPMPAPPPRPAPKPVAKPATKVAPAPAPSVALPGAATAGKIAAGWILVLLPLIAGLGLAFGGDAVAGLLGKISEKGLKGFQKVHRQLRGN